jgi:hypothetical protein
MTDCFEIDISYTNTLCGFKAEFFNVKLPPRTEVKKAWSYTSTPTVALHGTECENFNFKPRGT